MQAFPISKEVGITVDFGGRYFLLGLAAQFPAQRGDFLLYPEILPAIQILP